MLSSEVGANSTSNFALAGDYDASGDPTYTSAPVSNLGGSFLGLNHTISHLSIADRVEGHQVGLFGTVGHYGQVLWLTLKSARISGGNNSQVGALAGVSDGTISNDFVEGSISTGPGTKSSGFGALAGGLVGQNEWIVQYSGSAGRVWGGTNAIVGGALGVGGYLVGAVYSTADVSLPSGTCSRCKTGGSQNSAGGLVGANVLSAYAGEVYDSYATGSVAGGTSANLGGLVGFDASGPDSTWVNMFCAYSTGTVSGGSGSSIGGIVGFDQSPVLPEQVIGIRRPAASQTLPRAQATSPTILGSRA